MARAAEQHTSHTAATMGGYLEVVWRRKLLIAAAAVLGLVLGAVVLPNVRPGETTYRATVRLKVAELVSDTIVRERPQFDTGKGKTGDGNALQDVDMARRVLGRLGVVAAGLKADKVAAKLTAAPVTGSSFVDLSYTDTDPVRAGRVAGTYAKAWATRRNALDAKRLRAAMAGVDIQAAALQRQVTKLEQQLAGPTGAAPLSAPRSAELSRTQARLDALIKLRDDILKQQLFLGSPTAVVGGPVISQVAAPPPWLLVLILGLLVGLFVGVGLALLLEAVRPRVLAPEDVERATGVPVIATVPSKGMRRGGLPVLKRPFSPAAEGYRRLAGSLERRGLGDDIRIVAIASADAHEGKSLLALNLAHSLSRQGRDVVLVSGDLRRPRLDKLVDLEGNVGLAEWLQGGAPGTRPPLRTIAENLLFLPAGTATYNPGELLTTRRLRQGLQPLADAGFVVLIDTPPVLRAAEAMALTAAADATLLVARARVSRWHRIEQLAEGLRRDDVRPIGIVLLGQRTSPAASIRDRYGYVGHHQLGVGDAEQPWPVPPLPSPARNGDAAAPADEEASSDTWTGAVWFHPEPTSGPGASSGVPAKPTNRGR
jgi:Mrp family chromosome partitioning ATPase